MSQTFSIWTVIVLAAIAANLPFVNQRLFLVVPMKSRHKIFGWRLLELVVFYVLVGLVGRWFEGNLGQVAPQGWQFYAVTAALFVTLAFPGFVYRYLLRHRS